MKWESPAFVAEPAEPEWYIPAIERWWEIPDVWVD